MLKVKKLAYVSATILRQSRLLLDEKNLSSHFHENIE